ncbi:MAG: hypothetical protein J6D10_12460 [Clostridia bacterium]|nr:hypothetical protein [Clostridia bacterium]
MKHRIFCFLLALLTGWVSVGCAQDQQEPALSHDQTAVSAETPAAAEIVEEAEETGISDGLPEKDFEGAEFSILTTIWYNAKTYIYADELNGEIINDALYNQRASVEERFNVNILCTANDDHPVVGQTIHNLVLSGDDTYDIAFNHDNESMNNTMQGDFYNLREFELLDFDKPWWSGTSEVFTIQGKLFATATPLTTSGIFMNCSLSINKDLAEDLQLGVPYEAVRNGEWYMDDMISMSSAATADLNGNGKLDASDRWGFLSSNYGMVMLQSDMGAGILDKDEAGNLRFADDLDKIVSVMEKFDSLTEYAQICTGTDHNVGMFSEGRGLFLLSENRNLYESMRDSDVSYGILPCPKFDEAQKNYASAGYAIYWGVLLTAAPNEEVISYCLEAMSCYNYNDVVPKVWEAVLGSKLSDSADDTDMFNIIRDIQYVDLGYAFQGENPSINALVFLKANTTADQTVSFISKHTKAINKILDRLNSAFAEMGE